MLLVKMVGLFPTRKHVGCLLFLLCFCAIMYLRGLLVYGGLDDVPMVDSVLVGKLNHLAIVMDGNRRWAKQRGLLPWDGHKEGAKTIGKAVDFCLDKQIKFLSLYTFSLENVNRSEEEKSNLFSMIVQYFEKSKAELLSRDIRVRVIGDKTLFPKDVVGPLSEIEESTKDCKTLVLSFMFFYGGRQEILAAAKNLCQKIKAGTLGIEELNEVTFEGELWSHGLPHPDLLLRTGGCNRVSNFLLWQMAYTEMAFLKHYWPEVSYEILEKHYQSFLETKRTFGC